ncbi:MAG: class I SAM-dependent methyltransferase [Verrucomicrobiales bacterium]|nr:class I SAM-dependent methyltransferase [Verrucomicrobiales bacterium]
MDSAYWNAFYRNTSLHSPSNFATFCSTYLVPGMSIADLGCGSGRDSVYFAHQGLNVTGVDSSEVAIAKLTEHGIRRCEFLCRDFTLLGEMPRDCGYLRWSLHAITRDSQERVLRWLGANVRHLFIECRSVNDAMYGQGTQVGPDEFVTSHYRRFIRKEELERDAAAVGFDILSCEESLGWSRVDDDNPSLIRLVARNRNR